STLRTKASSASMGGARSGPVTGFLARPTRQRHAPCPDGNARTIARLTARGEAVPAAAGRPLLIAHARAESGTQSAAHHAANRFNHSSANNHYLTRVNSVLTR